MSIDSTTTVSLNMREEMAISLYDGLIRYSRENPDMMNALRFVSLDLRSMERSSETVAKLYSFVYEQSLRLICSCNMDRMSAATDVFNDQDRPLHRAQVAARMGSKREVISLASSFSENKFIYFCHHTDKFSELIQILVKSVQWSRSRKYEDTPRLSTEAAAFCFS